MALPHTSITQIPVFPKPAAVSSLWNLRYIEIDENFAYLEANKQPKSDKLTALVNLDIQANTIPYGNGAGTFALTPLTAFIRTLLDDADASAARATLGVPTFASDAEAIAGIDATKTINAQNLKAVTDLHAKLAAKNTFTKANVAAEAALPVTTGAVVLDLALANNFGGTLTGNITLANPTNMVAGQSGVIRITNDATPRTIVYGSVWKTPGGSLPALTASAGAVDLFGYYVESATRITIIQQADSK